MINEKLIDIINDLKNKRISDVEIVDILLLNNYTLEEIKENLKHYNETHGYSSENYIEKYEKIQGKKFSEEKISTVKKEEKNKTIEIKKEKVNNNKLKTEDLIAIFGIFLLLIIIIYVVIKYKLISF